MCSTARAPTSSCTISALGTLARCCNSFGKHFSTQWAGRRLQTKKKQLCEHKKLQWKRWKVFKIFCSLRELWRSKNLFYINNYLSTNIVKQSQAHTYEVFRRKVQLSYLSSESSAHSRIRPMKKRPSLDSTAIAGAFSRQVVRETSCSIVHPWKIRANTCCFWANTISDPSLTSSVSRRRNIILTNSSTWSRRDTSDQRWASVYITCNETFFLQTLSQKKKKFWKCTVLVNPVIWRDFFFWPNNTLVTDLLFLKIVGIDFE